MNGRDEAQEILSEILSSIRQINDDLAEISGWFASILRDVGAPSQAHPGELQAEADLFEELCASEMRKFGFPDARRTPKGPDGGVDVISLEAVAQAKLHRSNKISAQPIRALYASAIEHQVPYALFFNAGAGYSQNALEVATRLGVLCFEFDVKSAAFIRIT